MAITDVSGLTPAEILEDVPADTARIVAGGSLVSIEMITTWKNEAESRAALLLRAQGATTVLSDDAIVFAGEYVKKRVTGEVLRKLREFTVAESYLEDAKELEPVLRSFAEELDQGEIPGATIQSNVDTTTPTRKRWGSEYSGF